MLAVASFAAKAQRDRAKAQELEAKRTTIQSQSRGGQAQVIADGDLILLQNDPAVGAVQILGQSMKPEKMKCKWWYRDDGDGDVFTSDNAVSTGAEIVDWQLQFGTFKLEWSGSSENWGWIYMHKHPDIKYRIKQENVKRNLDLLSDTIDLHDLPEPKPYDNTIIR